MLPEARVEDSRPRSNQDYSQVEMPSTSAIKKDFEKFSETEKIKRPIVDFFFDKLKGDIHSPSPSQKNRVLRNFLNSNIMIELEKRLILLNVEEVKAIDLDKIEEFGKEKLKDVAKDHLKDKALEFAKKRAKSSFTTTIVSILGGEGFKRMFGTTIAKAIGMLPGMIVEDLDAGTTDENIELQTQRAFNAFVKQNIFKR